MSIFDRILNWEPFSRVRRNHALEHATLQVLAEKNANLRLAGYSDQRGFWLVGKIETEQVAEGVRQALARLQGGEHRLAIHPNCGTNLVTSGLVVGAFAWLGMQGVGRSTRDRLERLPLVITLVTLAMMLSQPLGPMVQERVTTSPVAQGMEILKIERLQRGDLPLHRVLIRF